MIDPIDIGNQQPSQLELLTQVEWSYFYSAQLINIKRYHCSIDFDKAARTRALSQANKKRQRKTADRTYIHYLNGF
jgi:hypothetical protein